MNVLFGIITIMPEKLRTLQKGKGVKTHGFRKRMKSHTGKATIARRKQKGRKRV